MKKILLLLTLITFSAFAQNPDYHRYGARTKFVQPDTLSTAQRTSLTPKLGTLIYHKDTGVSQWEQWDGDSWEELGGGAVDSVQGYTGDVIISPDDLDDSATTNKFVTATQKGLIDTALQDAPSDGNEYVRKDGDWEVASGGSDDQTASEVPFTPYSTIAATNVQDAIEEVLDEIPTSLAAANITVSPAIGGNTDAYAVMQANRTSIDSIQANMSSGVNTAFRTVTSTAGVFTEAFNDSQPNFELSLDEDVAITITSAVNGNFIIAELYNDDVSENDFLVTLNGTSEDLIANIPFGGRAFFTMITNSSNEITWLRSYPKGYKPVTVYNSATIAMDGDSVYDDMTADAATLTLSDCQIGETLKVYINRASMPTLAGTDLVFNQLPGTTIFEADTDMVITFIVTPLLDTGDMVVDYYLTER